MTLIGVPAFTMIAIVWLGVQGRSANAVPGTGATAQRGHGDLERRDERTAIGALRSIISCLLSRGGDTQVRK